MGSNGPSLAASSEVQSSMNRVMYDLEDKVV